MTNQLNCLNGATALALAIAGALAWSSTSVAQSSVAPVPRDFTTGGGFVITDGGSAAATDGKLAITDNEFAMTDDGSYADFGLVAGCKNGGFFGDVSFVDHDTTGDFSGLQLSSITITGYFDPCPGGGCAPDGSTAPYRDICGTANTNLFGPIHFRVRTRDAEERGVGVDRFGLEGQSDILNERGVIVQIRYISGGNLQLHGPNRSTTGPDPYPTEEQGCPGTTPSMLGY